MITNKLQLYQAAQILQDKKHKLCLQHNKRGVQIHYTTLYK